MKKLTYPFLLLLSLIHVSPAFSADLQTANAAYSAGDYEAAAKEYTALANQGNVLSQISLAVMYLHGDPALRNEKEGIKWLTRAAEQGVGMAQFMLSLAYQKGDGVPQNDETAIKWATLAAERGHVIAQMFLAVEYLEGKTLPKDTIRAHMWLNIAASGGEKKAMEMRDTVASSMSASDITSAQDLAQKCKEKKLQGC